MVGVRPRPRPRRATRSRPGRSRSPTTTAARRCCRCRARETAAASRAARRSTYGGTVPADVRVYGSVSGGLAGYLTLTVTRGTIAGAPAAKSCTSFVADSTDYLSKGAGVIYSGNLSAFPTSAASALVDPTERRHRAVGRRRGARVQADRHDEQRERRGHVGDGGLHMAGGEHMSAPCCAGPTARARGDAAGARARAARARRRPARRRPRAARGAQRQHGARDRGGRRRARARRRRRRAGARPDRDDPRPRQRPADHAPRRLRRARRPAASPSSRAATRTTPPSAGCCERTRRWGGSPGASRCVGRRAASRSERCRGPRPTSPRRRASTGNSFTAATRRRR